MYLDGLRPIGLMPPKRLEPAGDGPYRVTGLIGYGAHENKTGSGPAIRMAT